MEELIQELNDEAEDLEGKLDKLTDFLLKYKQLYSDEYVKLMDRQRIEMCAYLLTLHRRIELIGGSNDKEI